MMNDLDIKNKRILLFDFDGTLIETASGNTFATDLTDMRIKMDVVNKALDLMQENGVKVFAIVSNQGGVEAGVVYVLDVSFGADSKTIFKKWLDEGKSLMWIDHHKGIIEDSKTWGFVVPGLRRVGVGACALASDLLMGKVPAIVRCLSDYDVWNKESELGWDTVVAVQYALRSKIRLNVLIALSYLYDHFKENMKDNEVDLIFYDLAKEGRAIINYMAGKNEQEVSAYSFEAYVDEVKVVAMNTTEFSSKVFDSLTRDWLDGMFM